MHAIRQQPEESVSQQHSQSQCGLQCYLYKDLGREMGKILTNDLILNVMKTDATSDTEASKIQTVVYFTMMLYQLAPFEE